MAALEELGTAIGKAAGAAGPSVVGIGGHWRRGSGIVLAKDRVLTNVHNVRGDGTTCVFSDGRQERGRLLGYDVDGDLAVLDVPTGDVPPLPWAEASAVDGLGVGAPVFAVASAAGGGLRTTSGFVSARDRSFRGPGGRLIAGSVEHTAPLASGSSGSPIVDARGRLLGLNTQRLGEGFYLALPADASLKTRVDALSRGESTARPRLGIAVAPGHVARHLRRSVGLPEKDGVLVRGVEEGSPAEKAGIREGDLVVSVESKPVANPDQLQDALAAVGAAKVRIGVVRGVEEIEVTAELDTKPAD